MKNAPAASREKLTAYLKENTSTWGQGETKADRLLRIEPLEWFTDDQLREMAGEIQIRVHEMVLRPIVYRRRKAA